jgi:hypothetical protein
MSSCVHFLGELVLELGGSTVFGVPVGRCLPSEFVVVGHDEAGDPDVSAQADEEDSLPW